jgi:hypothetical protein
MLNGLYESAISLALYIYGLSGRSQTSMEPFWASLVPDYKHHERGTVSIAFSIEEPLAIKDEIYALSFYLPTEAKKEELVAKGYSLNIHRLLDKGSYRGKEVAICGVRDCVQLVDWDDFCTCFHRVLP